jgi:hypothetical protein
MSLARKGGDAGALRFSAEGSPGTIGLNAGPSGCWKKAAGLSVLAAASHPPGATAAIRLSYPDIARASGLVYLGRRTNKHQRGQRAEKTVDRSA